MINLNNFYFIILGFAIFLFAGFIRVRPVLYHKNYGIDHWYWLLCTEELKNKKRIPIVLNNFILEIDEQWYPPLYSLFLSIFPLNFLKKRGYVVVILIDCIQLLVLYCFTYYITNNYVIAISAAFIYSITPFLINYNIQLNPRGLASLLFIIVMIIIYFYHATSKIYLIPIVIIIGVLILLLHKMATQLLIFTLMILSIIELDLIYIYFTIGIIIFTFIFSMGFYSKVLSAHWDIVSFWNRNRNYVNAHQYYESPLYRKEEFKSTAFHNKGIKGVLNHVRVIFFANPFIILSILYGILNFNNLSTITIFLFKLNVIIFIWIILTTFIPQLKCLGAGVNYIYFSALPTAYLISESIYNGEIIYVIAAVILVVLSILKIIRIYKKIKYNREMSINNDLIKTFNYLEKLPENNILCIPLKLSDAAAYFTRKKILWGGHSYGFKKLEEFFPIIRGKIEDIIVKYDINFILLDIKYLSIHELIKDKKLILKIYKNENYTVYKVIRNRYVISKSY